MKKSVILFLLLLFAGGLYAQQRIKGIVTSMEDGSPLPGVNIVVKGSTQGVVSDANGKYTIDVPDPKGTLVFSFVGFLTEEIAIDDRNTIDLVMTPSIETLGEVVVTALGIKREEKALGYAISSIDSKEITKVGSTNIGSALYGKASGVRISTAPGGATSAVLVNIRGINSINFNSQPLVIMDGVPIRNGESNNVGYWGDTRIRGNGLIDINPEDIENISILKGASASALYGSEAANGVLVITTKSGANAKKGLGVDVNITYTVEKVAYTPKYQNEYGPGYDYWTNTGGFGSDEDSWLWEDTDGDGTAETPRPIYRAYGQFGPKFDGRQVIGWDGQMHPYVAQPDNYKDFYRTGYNGIYNIAITHNSENANFRLSYTRNDYKGIQIGGDHYKNSFNLTGQIKLGKKVTTDVGVNYIDQYTHNRPEQINRLTCNYGGFFSRFDDMQWYFDNYKTSKNYKYDRYDASQSATPDEKLKYHIRAYDLLDFIWKQQENSYDENSDRLIGSVTTTWDIYKGLKLRGKLATDYTTTLEQTKNRNEYPIAIQQNSGYYGQTRSTYNILYGDVLLMYNGKITQDFSLSANFGVTGRSEGSDYNYAGTNGGLSVEDWYHLKASNDIVNADANYTDFIKYAYLGTLGIGFRDYAFIEATGRQEYSSTLPPKSNSFFYPSVNASFLYSDAFDLPEWLDYGKLRASWGIVGNAPPIYQANNAYIQSHLNGVIYNKVPSAYGNDMIKPEEKHEFEIGLENKFFHNRLGLEITYYNSRIVDQILQLTIPPTTGFSSMLANVGELKNQGWEFGLYGSPVKTNNLEWELRVNAGFNKNEVVKLMEGVEYLTHSNIDAGAALIISKPGETMGDIMCYVPAIDDQGRNIIDDNGLYRIDFSEMKKVGNAMPKVIGGLGNTLTYKGIVLDFNIDFRFGGDIISLTNYYAKGAGLWEETLKYRDAEHDGTSYYIDPENGLTATNADAGPNGEKVFHDGVILPGVKGDGSTNDIIVDAPSYYLNTYTWGANPSWGIPNSRYDDAVWTNSYVKFRELSLGYTLPVSMTKKFGCNRLTVSLIGRNLFFIYKNIPHLDPEVTIGSSWVTAAVESGTNAAQRSLGFSIRASF
jgi:iron complex outermembrane recepter protein